MSTAATSLITLAQAQQLVDFLEKEDQESANKLLNELQNPIQSELFAEIGKLTRQLHDSMSNFQIDSRISDLANADIPDAKERLNYVISRTEDAANKTMDAVESIFPVVDNIQQQLKTVNPLWVKLMHNDLNLGEFKGLCIDIDTLLKTTSSETERMHALMTDVLLAQDFQDLTGQVIRKVIDLVREVEESLINMLTMFGVSEEEQSKAKLKTGENLVEGPIVNTENRDDVVADQDDVDDLLSSLGF